MARLSLMALGQESLVGMVDTADEGFGSDELNRRKPGTSGEIARPVIFDTDPLVETGCREINDCLIYKSTSPRDLDHDLV